MVEKAFEAVIKWVAGHLSPRYLGVTALITGLLLFLPHSALQYFGADALALKYRGGISIIFFFSVFLTATYPLESMYRPWSEKKHLRKDLCTLPLFENALLRRCLLNEGRSTEVIADAGTAKSLEKKGILWQSSERNGRVGYSITRTAYEVLKEEKFVQMFVPEKEQK